MKDICNYYRIAPATFYRWEKEGRIPPPFKPWGSRRWLASEVIEALRKVNIAREKE